MSFKQNDVVVGPGVRLSRSRRLFFALLLAMLGAFGPLSIDTYLPSLPQIAGDLSISTATTQITITAFLLGMAIGQVFIGPISDSHGRRGPLLLALVFFTLASFFCARATSGESFIALRFAQGLSGAGGVVLSRAIACDLFRGAELTSFMAVLIAIQSVAPIMAPLLGGGLAILGGWHAVFVFLTIFGLLLVCLCAWRLPETLLPEARRPGGVFASLRYTGKLFKEKAFMCFAGVQGFTMAGFFGYVAASPFIFQDMYGFSHTAYAMIFGANALSLSLMAVITGRLARRVKEEKLLVAGNVLRWIACLIVLVVTIVRPASPWPLIAALYCMITLQGVTFATSFTLGIAAQDVGAGAASGVIGVAAFIFGAFSSPLVGLAGPETAVPLGIVCAVTGTATLLLSLMGNKALRQRRERLAAAKQPEN